MSTGRRATSAAFAVTFVLLLAACGGGDSGSAATTAAPSPTTAVPADATTAAPSADAATTAVAAGSGGGGSRCGAAVDAVATTFSGDARIVKIDTDGSCAVNVFTSLAATSDTVSDALDLCDRAAAVAYTNGATGVVIYAVGNKEQAIGIKDAQCIGEP